MKNFYTIHEIAELYGIGSDSLRYYERLELIHPKRGENGYRLYSLKDMYRLTIIRDLLQLGFSTGQIKDYLSGLSIQNTLTMLENERQLLRRKIEGLQETERSLGEKMQELHFFRQQPPMIPSLSRLPPRSCARLSTDINRDEEFDFAIKKLHHRHADTIRDLGTRTLGASISRQDLDAGRFGLFRSVFIVLPDAPETGDFELPGGLYARLLYQGSYEKSREAVQKLRFWAASQGLLEAGDVLEIYRIDNRYTAREDEFLTEVQMPVIPKEESAALPLSSDA